MLERVTSLELEALCAFWQTRLKLRDWDVTVRWAEKDEITGFGLCQYFLPKRHATITIQPEAWRPERLYESIEQTVIHELLHLHFAVFDRGAARLAVEQTVHAIASGIVLTLQNTKHAAESASFGI